MDYITELVNVGLFKRESSLKFLENLSIKRKKCKKSHKTFFNFAGCINENYLFL